MWFGENTLVGNMWVQIETECLRNEKKGDESNKLLTLDACFPSPT